MLRGVSPSASTRRAWILRWGVMATIAATLGAVTLFAGCASHHTPDFDTNGSDSSVDVPGTDAGSMASFSTGDDASAGSFGSSGGGGSTTYDDFQSPVLDGPDGGAAAAPSNAPAVFGPTSQGARSGGPCLTEPGANALFPRNWLRPLFRWSAPEAQNLFELRLHTANQKSDLAVYTASTSWTMPKAVWDLLRLDSNDAPITVTIRGGTLSGGKLSDESLGSQTTIGVAPADAPGTIVYWTSAEGTTLKGFQVGDETVGSTLIASQVQEVTLDAGQCMGCHTGAPDGEYSILAESGNNWGDFVALVDPDAGAVGSAPPFLGAGAKTTLSQGPLGMSAVSKAHWSQGDHVMLASDDTDIVWIDLESANANSARGALPRSGAPSGVVAVDPAWTHDGKTVVYVSSALANAGRPGSALGSRLAVDPGSTADLYRVAYNDRMGGAVAPVAGAADSQKQEYYPAFSPDDAYLVFNECDNGLSMYNQAQAEVYVIPSQGGTATRLHANDPTACSGMASPGVTNSWAKWAPAVTKTADGRSFYWIVFSSKRLGTTPQLFVSGMQVDGKGAISTYGALYLWNQPSTEGNHTPAWEYFNVPPPPPVVPK
jgi:hypothetical protein